MGILDNVSAVEASMSVDGSGLPGSTIASNTEHLRWSLASAYAALRGEGYQPDWKESWHLLSADAEEWRRLRQTLRAEYKTLLQALKKQEQLSGDYLNGLLSMIPHAAYHLGTIRQMIARARSV